MRVINMFACLAFATSVGGGLVACSTSEFGAKAIKSSGGGEANKAETDESSGDGGDAGDTAVSDNGSGGETLNSDGAKELDGRSDSARRNDIDDTTTGCKLPDDIASKVNGGGDKGLDLLGWGSSDRANPAGLPELSNLDLNDCAWFKAGNVKQVYVFQQKSAGLVEGVTQSYVEPVQEGTSPLCGKFAGSIAASVRDRGTFMCAFLPQSESESIFTQ